MMKKTSWISYWTLILKRYSSLFDAVSLHPTHLAAFSTLAPNPRHRRVQRLVSPLCASCTCLSCGRPHKFHGATCDDIGAVALCTLRHMHIRTHILSLIHRTISLDLCLEKLISTMRIGISAGFPPLPFPNSRIEVSVCGLYRNRTGPHLPLSDYPWPIFPRPPGTDASANP